MNRFAKKCLALALCALVLGLGMSAVVLMGNHRAHCTHDGCSVCLAIGEAMRISRLTFIFAAAALTALTACVCPAYGGRHGAGHSQKTPVEAKTVMLN